MKTLLFIFIFLTLHLDAKVIIDDYGRSVTIPDKITKIYAASPPLTMSVLAFDPSLIAALNMPFNDEQKAYVGNAFTKPVAGGFFGQGQAPNFEVLAASKPDVILVWGGMTGVEKIVRKFSVLHIPVVLVKNSSIADLVSQFELYAKLTGNYKRANELIAYTKQTLSLIDSLQAELKKHPPVRYYFAEGIDGLKSECDDSFHLEPFLYSGAKNALDCKMSSNYGMEQISLETILLANPDVFIVMEKEFYKNIDARFSSLDAIKNRRVYLVPSHPFNYITRPPSFMRLMGIRWLIHTFYPHLLNDSLLQEQKRFEELFFKDYKE
ncbi:ABC transporter substrate-binding protein [Sulfurimonas sp.]|uniref:ABC transporter substrate-binding protein n=1 Tax=Sulfurimonas sp. TaxID=2022749 RepID=UPI003D105F4E